ncbi:MAG: kelch repeat-containing protein [Candidatus Bathyarchaeia archaeon]
MPSVVFSANTVETTWESLEPMSAPRSGHGVAVLDGLIYVFGFGNTTEVYDPETDTWVSKKGLPTGRMRFGVAAYENKIYVIGGLVGALASTGVNEVYAPETDRWEQKSGIPGPVGVLDGFCANVVNNKIYIISGIQTALPPYINSVDTLVYFPSNDSWTTKTPIPTPVYGYASAVIDNKIYIIGGRDISRNAIYNLTQIYDTDTDTWRQGAPIPANMYLASAAATTGVFAPKKIYVFGGFNHSEALNSTFVYDPENDTWTTGSPFLPPRYAFGVAVINDLIYVIGGYNKTTGFALNERYTPADYIPEFPAWVMLPLLLVVSLFVVLFKKRLTCVWRVL